MRTIGLTAGKAEAEGAAPQDAGYGGMTAAQLDGLLDERGVERPKRLTNAERIALLEGLDAAPQDGGEA